RPVAQPRQHLPGGLLRPWPLDPCQALECRVPPSGGAALRFTQDHGGPRAMNAALISELVGLRYKLLWAKTRSRNGRIALFLSGYLLLVLLLGLLGAGGIGAAIAAVKAGKTEFIAQAVLGGIFFQAVI